MSERIRESLSALIDNEAHELELERVLSQSQQDEVRATWSRFQVVRSVMRGEEISAYQGLDISARVQAALADDAASAVAVPQWRAALQGVASFAVAASVFAAVLVGSQLYGLLGTASTSGAYVVQAPRVSPAGGVPVAYTYGASANRPDARKQRNNAYNKLARQRLQRYMVPHADQAALNTPQGMMPYARVSSFKAEE